MTTYGFYPSAQQATFVPDQLIAGDMKLVTGNIVLLAGQGVLPRGTIIGIVTSGANAATGTNPPNCNLCVQTATDGSQTPVGVLVDQVDTTAGNANGGAYLMGEFNVNAISYDSSWTPSQLSVALRPVSIFLKSAIAGDIVL